jgi:hypothetical protein
MTIFDRLKSLLGGNNTEEFDEATVTNTVTGERTRGPLARRVVTLPEIDTRRNSPASTPSAIAGSDDDMPDGDVDLAEKAAATKPIVGSKEGGRTRKDENDQQIKTEAAKDKKDAPAVLPTDATAASATDEGGGLPTRDEDGVQQTVVRAQGRFRETFQEQLQRAVDKFLEAEADSFRRGDEISELLDNAAVLNKLLDSEDPLIRQERVSSFLDTVMSSSFDQTFDAIPEGRFSEGIANIDAKGALATILRNKDILKLFYFDDTVVDTEDLSNAGTGVVDPLGFLLRYNNKSVKQLGTALEDVRLTTETILGYAKDNERSDNERFPTFVLDQKLYIQGVEVSKYLKGSATVSKNNVTGHNTLTFTLDNSNDKFVWTDRNLGFSVFERSYFYDENGDKIFYSSEQDKEYARRLARALTSQSAESIEDLDAELASTRLDKSFLQYEAAKKKVFDYKTNPNINPINVDAYGNKLFTRFDLVPNKCVFARMDPIRLFSLYPFRPNTGAADELWMPEFAGFIENVSIEDDDVLGTSTITIECADIRQSILTRMRISSSVSSSLTNPLDLLGLRPKAIFDDGTTNTGDNTTPQQQQIIAEVQKVSPHFFNEKDREVTFYDDVINSVFGTDVPPNMNLEETVKLLLVFKYDAIKKGRARRGVNNIQYGGTFRTPWNKPGEAASYPADQVRSYLQEYHLFTLFGPKRRPWTDEEVDYVGTRTVTINPDQQGVGDFTPLNCRLWFLFPRNDSGPANLAELTTANIQMAHEANWTNRIEVLRNVIEGVDYQMFVSGTGDIHVEFPFADFRPEDFGIFKDVFRFQRATISTSYSDEAEEPIAGLTVVTGWSAGATNTDQIAEAFYQKSFAFSPYIAARYGMNVTQTVSIPYLSIKEKPIAQQRAVIEFQKANARCNTLQFQSAYRPFLLPNRPVHHLRRSRIGLIVSSETTFEIGASPKGSVSVGLEHVRTWTGGYRFEAPETVNGPQKEEYTDRKTDREVPADEKGSKDSDPYSQQVFVSVMAGTNLPTSGRAAWGVESPVAANSGVYVIDLQKFNETQVAREPTPEPDPTPQDDTKAADTAAASISVAPPTKQNRKWAGNPLAVNSVTSHWSPVRILRKRLPAPHTGTDFTGVGDLTDVSKVIDILSVDNGKVSISFSKSTNPNSDRNPSISLNADNGLRALYVHIAPIGMIPKSLFQSTESTAYDAALLAAKNYAVADFLYRSEYKKLAGAVALASSNLTKITNKKAPKAPQPQIDSATVALQKAQQELATLFLPTVPTSKYYMAPGTSYKVNTGDVIGLMSNTGNSFGVHLHFETIDNDNPVNWPFDYASLLPEGGTQISKGSPKVDSFYYLPGPLTGKPHKEVTELDAKIRADIEALKKK